MGNCLGKKNKCKRTAVAQAQEDDVCERISRATPRPGCSSVNQTDVTKALEESKFEESKIAPGGVSLIIDLQEGDPERLPLRLASRMDGACSPARNDNEVHYTPEERELLAEINREEVLHEKREKALQRDIKHYDASRRRAARKLVANSGNGKNDDQINE